MTIKLKGSTDGSVSLQAPADTSPTGTDITLTLPTTAGSADQFVKNSGTAGTLEYSSMVETSTGVGIGTTSPQTKLEVDNGSPSGTLPTLGGLLVTNAGTSSSTAAMCVATGSGPVFNVMNNGRVGIGTSSPSEIFEVLISPSNSSKVYTSTAGGGSVFAGWNVDGGTNASARAQYNFHHGATNTATIYSAWNGSSMTEFNIRTFNTSEIKLKVNSTDRIRATNAGAVINGSLSKSSGSFKIDHPLPSKAATHDLVHSFVEAPDASNLYAGMVDLVDGTATVNIDTAHRMTEGTFEALNTVQSWSSSNESGYAPVKCSISGNLLTIECQDATSTDTVYYEVRGVRKDQHMLDTEWTDENGRVITEPLKESDNTEAGS